ncbi:Metallo-dependent phosphatase [Macrolepiota fuliginosa MF-IS2]|uniref:Serine/threonine-protein phosphatase n=1 Tax=Macrolepiota fuliginosa MF-IS2 TaxID=1400762 RepID=A0A9P5XII2_9AGAR|nr:Metallo-dependent phosphatase [Macrolepiota fuliginosa MF-IS2]
MANKKSRSAQERNAFRQIQQAQQAQASISPSQSQGGSGGSSQGQEPLPPPTRYPTGPVPDPDSQPPSRARRELAERRVKNVPPPATHRPTDAEFFLRDARGERMPNASYLKDHFFNEGRILESHAVWIVRTVMEILKREPNMVKVGSPMTVCGDIHGQYYDLMKLFEVGGPIGDTTYLFLGDYVDRGDFGIECLLYLYALKIWYPQKVILLRGNHECRHLTEYFTFKRECLHKYSSALYEACIESFCTLPVAALVDHKFFCVHGGLSPELVTLEDMERMNRFQEPGSRGLLCDLLWADPIQAFGNEEGVVPPGSKFLPNATRGCSYYYTYEAVCQFLERNNLLTVIRGHEAQDAGYTMHKKTPKKHFPSVITIFSAPNYLDVYHNRAAVLKYANKNITIRQYNSSPHPYWLPNFMDAFTWSLPFVGAKITEMLLAILSICSQEELVDGEGEGGRMDEDASEELAARRQQIKNKILAVGRMQKVFQLLREEAENATELVADEGAAGTSRMGPDALGVHGNKINRSIRTFADARRSDLLNERLPEFNPEARPAVFPTPSMRVAGRRGSGDTMLTDIPPGGINMEYLIKKSLEEEEALEGEGGVVERLAERIARGRNPTGRPAALKRHDTA